MKNLLAALAASALILMGVGPAQAGALAPAPQIIAKYDRGFIERSGAQTFGEMLDTGILRYFFTGGRNLLVMVNGRPYATTASNLDTIPLSAVERIEVIRAESLGTISGQAAVRGAFNLVLRNDLDGFDARFVTRQPSRAGGEAGQGSIVWGEKFGTDGRVTFGIDIFERSEIAGKNREHSRSKWTSGGNFSGGKNISIGGNTAYVFDRNPINPQAPSLRTVPIGDCDESHGYTGELSNPSGITAGDKGCGYAYGNVWWDSPSHKQKNAIMNLSQPLGERAEFRMDANFTEGRSQFRYAPSVGVFTITPNASLLTAMNAKAQNSSPSFTVDAGDIVSIAHRFLGHGNRDWTTDSKEYDISAGVSGLLTENLGYDAQVSLFDYDSLLTGNTFVDTARVRAEIQAGRYDVANPLSDDPVHLEAIRRSSLQEKEDVVSKYRDARFALEGTAPGLGGHDIAWTAGVQFARVKAHRLLSFRGQDGRTVGIGGVLGSGGTSYSGERKTKGYFSEINVPLTSSTDVRIAASFDDYDDIGKLRSLRVGSVYRPNDILSLRGSLSRADGAPSMFFLHSTAAQGHPYVSCVPPSGPPPRTCATVNPRQVQRITTGNPDLEPANSERSSFGFGLRDGPSYFIADWYQLKSSKLPGQNFATWTLLNYPECTPGQTKNCIEYAAGAVTIYDSYANVVDTNIIGLNTRFGTRIDKDSGFLSMRGFWRYVSSSEQRIAGEKRRFPLPRHAIRIVSSIGRDNLTAYWALNHRSEIQNIWGDGQFEPWTGHDLTFDWKMPSGIENLRLTAGVYNVTDAKLSQNTADPTSHDGPRAAGWGRTFFVTLNMRF